jgi:chitin biosynthesis protein CHS5
MALTNHPCTDTDRWVDHVFPHLPIIESLPLISPPPLRVSTTPGERAHLIEFPSLLLPPGVTSGSIVNISVDRNTAAEQAQAKEFWSLQDSILQEYGLSTPQPPQLKLRHVTQTSVTLEWQSLDLAKAKLRSLEILKNGTRLATIPNPTVNTSTKLSSLQMNEEYSFQLIL